MEKPFNPPNMCVRCGGYNYKAPKTLNPKKCNCKSLNQTDIKRIELIDFMFFLNRKSNISILSEFGKLADEYISLKSKCKLNKDYEYCKVWEQNNCECVGCKHHL